MPGAEARYKITADDQTRRGLRSAQRRLSLFAAGLAGAAIGALTNFQALFATITRGLTNAQRRLDAFAKAGLEIGSDAEDVRELGEAADRLGVSFEKAVRVVDRLNKAIGEDSAEYEDAFKQLGVSPSALASIDDATDRLVALGSALEQLEQQEGRAVREAVESTLVGRNVSKLFAEGGRALAAEVERANTLDLIRGTNEAAAAAERAGDAWAEAGAVWSKLFENSGFFAAAERTANLLTAAGQNLRERGARRREAPTGQRVLEGLSPAAAVFNYIRDLVRRPDFGRDTMTQAGGFIPQQVPERLSQAATKQRQSADSLVRATRVLERTLNRFGP